MKDYNVFGSLDSKTGVIFVGGYGDNNNTYNLLITELLQIRPEYVYFTFTFPKVKNQNTLNYQANYLSRFMKFIISKYNVINFVIMCTSDGAYSTSHLLVNNEFKNRIKTVVFIDPADYHLKQGDDNPWDFLWPGFTDYKPRDKTVSDLIKEFNGVAKIHVINLTIRNYSTEGYPDNNLRGVDNPKLYTRLSNKMVKSFYQKIKVQNKGNYIELNNIPHAFMRDGDLEKNIKLLTDPIRLSWCVNNRIS